MKQLKQTANSQQQVSLKKSQAIFSTAAALPALRSDSWNTPATRAEILAFVAKLIEDLNPVKDKQATQRLVRLASENRVTVPEMLYAHRKMQSDIALDKKLQFDRPITYADIAAHIEPIRNLRMRLRSSSFTELQLIRLIEEFPDMLTRSMFGKSGVIADFKGDLFRFCSNREAEVFSMGWRKPAQVLSEDEKPERRGIEYDWRSAMESERKKAEAKAHKTTRKERLLAMSAKNYAQVDSAEHSEVTKQ